MSDVNHARLDIHLSTYDLLRVYHGKFNDLRMSLCVHSQPGYTWGSSVVNKLGVGFVYDTQCLSLIHI